MSDRPIIDAGPGLNFLSIHKERLLIEVLGQLSAPEAVQREVLRKARQDGRFCHAATVWRKLTPRWIEILPDKPTPEFAGPGARGGRRTPPQQGEHARDLQTLALSR
ncbi:MAG TPA: hypothetical protein VF444_06075 [Pseudonocardiaceae bacterium]